MSDKKSILIVFTGGTFSMKIDKKKSGGAVPKYSGAELLKKIPEAKKIADISFYDFGKYPGPHVTPEIMMELSKQLRKRLTDKKYDGIIITHGTDTLEETAYLIDLTIKTEIPIVFTGSMRNSSEQNWDGPKNLIDSLLVCLSKNSREMGTLVCMNGEVNAASEVTKIFSNEFETFQSLDFGTLGFVEKGRVIYNRLPRFLETINTNKINTNVDLLTVYAGMDEKFFRHSADSDADGLVIEALGVGNVPPAAFKGIEYVIKKNIPVVLVSRCPAGETDYIYSYPGAGRHLHDLGVIFTDYLNGQKARIKLMLALAKTSDRKILKKIFEGEIREI
ncbi:MAG: asparaginase [Ignavibacteriota bacterium]|jgi:L-asparaginase|nr:MAG: asparaginase [Chlorobiota bacterium]MBE7476167.1 asparaginase [Ignavibacteriales bacterium]MBL1124158.1 asparaginase [Ignavibacteriota bacterium]MCC7093515.1 asparaginase [Ignavibacteriaceae bacterium]MCE7857653.1 asparaginase [Ignavibacteria bacterium CHB3]MEB2297380.1 asparaginase [Ignavibacteria bacterium]